MSSLQHTAQSYLETAENLIAHLQATLNNTKTQKQWTDGNLDALRNFTFLGFDVKQYPTPARDIATERKGEFLWDYIAYAQGFGILLAAESEWRENHIDPQGLKHDFEKLLYVKSPLKIMMCRRNHRNDGATIAGMLSMYAREACSNYSPGEVFILYCVGWLADDSRNDEVFLWQVPGPVVSCVNSAFEFKPQ
jgi:hypothetical protein